MMMPMQRGMGLGAGAGTTPTTFTPGERYSMAVPNAAGNPTSVAQAQAQFDTILPGQLKVVGITLGASNTTMTFDWIGAPLSIAASGFGSGTVTIMDLGPTPTNSNPNQGASTGNTTLIYAGVGVGVVALGGLIWYLAARQKKAKSARELGEGGAGALDNPITLRMEPGYAYKRVRGEWEDVVVSENVTDRAKFAGYMDIYGTRMAVFDLGRAIYAQLPQNLRRIDSAEDGYEADEANEANEAEEEIDEEASPLGALA